MWCRESAGVVGLPCTIKKTVGRIEADFRSLALADFQTTQNIVRVIDIGVFARADDFWLVRAHRPKGLAAVRET